MKSIKALLPANHNVALHSAIVVLCSCLGGYNASAQASINFGPRIGLNVSSARYNHNNTSPYDLSTSAVNRLEAGIAASISSGHFALQPALLYSPKGFVLKGVLQSPTVGNSRPINAQVTSRLNYLTLPINFVYAQKSNGEGVQVFVGGYMSLLLGGKRIVHNEYQSNTMGSDFYDSESSIKPGSKSINANEFYSKRLDAGLQAGLGYRYRSTLIQVTYSLGINNLEASDPALAPELTPTYYNRVVQASLSYLFKANSSSKR